jgi:hypothetical protein
MTTATVRKRRRRGESYTADYLVERDGVLLAICTGNQLMPSEPSIGQAERNAGLMAAAFAGEPLPAGWRVETGGGNYRVRDSSGRIAAWRRYGYLTKETSTIAEIEAMPQELKGPVHGNEPNQTH